MKYKPRAWEFGDWRRRVAGLGLSERRMCFASDRGHLSRVERELVARCELYLVQQRLVLVRRDNLDHTGPLF